MNVNLLGHIALDSELSGRYGLQGNTFKNTVGYLRQYIQSRANIDPGLADLAIKMECLVKNETCIRDLDHASKDEEQFDAVVEQMMNQIEISVEGDDVLIPGGWGHIKEGGHALIYQFQKTPTGLSFSIYNAGDGSDTHEHWSTIKNERFYPVKRYELIHPIQRDRLKQFIRQLILPQLIMHPAHDKAGFDAAKLDTALKREIALLGGKAIKISEHISKDMATTGQLSGTCAQRSIHQMLKLNFSQLADYQRFMFEFKMHALRDFINTHQPPRAKAIAELLTLAIENNLKLLHIASVFTSEEQEIATHELIQLKQSVMAENAIKSMEPRTPILQSETEYKLSVCRNQLLIKQKKGPSNAAQQSKPISTRLRIPDIILIDPHSLLLEQLDVVVTQCQAMESLDPLWVLRQIEKTLLQLPLPDENPACYQAISSPEEVDRMITDLETLQTLYVSAYQKSCKDTKLPSLYMTHWSLLALHDHFETQQAAQQNRPTFHRYIDDQFRIIWSELQISPKLATYHPERDQRIQALMHHYQSSEKRIKFTDSFFLSHYMSIFNSFPKLKKKLEHLHSLKEWPHASYHRLMAEQGLSGMIYLSEALKTNDPFLDKNEFAPLLDAIHHQMQYEQFIARSLHAVSDCGQMANDVFEFVLNSLRIESVLNHTSDDGEGTHEHYKQLEYQYDKNLSKSSVQDRSRFYREEDTPHKHISKMSSHEIQIYAHDRYEYAHPVKSDYSRRDRYHLRTSSANQINLTVDGFKSAIHKLENLQNRICLDDNIFQPALLSDLLRRDAGFIQRFDEFIQIGFQAFMDEKGQLNHKSRFLIQLSTYFNRYISEMHSEMGTSRLKNQQTQLRGLLEVQRDPNIIWEAHYFHFVTLMALHPISDETEQQHLLAEALFSHIYLNNHSGLDVAFELIELQHAFKAWLQKTPKDDLASAIKAILPDIGIVMPDCHIGGTYPLFSFRNSDQSDSYSIDIESGRIFKDKLQYRHSLPLWINRLELLSQLPEIRADHSCLISLDGKCVELIGTAIPTRIVHTPSGMSIQKKWIINGQADWYERQTLSQKQQTTYHSSTNPGIEHNLPACLTDDTMKVWVNSINRAILTRHDKPIYHTNQTGHLERFDDAHQILVPATDQRLLAFEDRQFFCVHIDQKTQTGTVDFVRYGLSLNITNDHVTLPDSAYELTATDTSPFDPMVACMNFSDGHNQKCIVAVQRAYVDPNQGSLASGEYYPLIHDKAGYIKAKEIGLPHYENTEIAITYPIVNGKPKPGNAADALYLCYLYLMTHKTEEAWAVLDDLNKRFGLGGNVTELKYLAWIVNALPTRLRSDFSDTNEHVQLKNPRYVACQLKALALLTDHLNQGKTLSSRFSEDLPSAIYRLYTSFQQMKRHLSVHYMLSDHESKSLLYYFYQQKKYPREGNPNREQKIFTVFGALGYEWRHLTLKTLCIEYQRLLILCSHARQSNQSIPVGIRQRLADIQKEFDDQLDVISLETRLEQVPIRIPAYTSGSLDLKIIPKGDEPDMPALMEQAIEALSTSMNDADFAKHMLVYVRIALNNDHPARPLLQAYCTRFLIADAHDKNFAQGSIQLNVLRLIYSVLNNTDYLASQCTQLTTPLTLGALPGMLKRCPEQPPIMIYQAQNVFDTLLASTRDIREIVEKELPVHVPLHTSRWMIPESLTIKKLIQDKTPRSLRAMQMKYQEADLLEELRLKALLKGHLSQEEQEHAAGQFKYQREQTQRTLAKTYLSDPSIRETLYKNTSMLHDTIDRTVTEQWQDALQLARTTFQTIPFKLESAAGLRRELKQDDLLKLYFHADQTLYQDMTGIEDPDVIKKLHQCIHQCVTLEVQKQHATRLMNALDLADALKTDSALHQVANTLMAVNHVKAQTDPQLMLFQYYENMLLRPRQLDALSHLLSTGNAPHSFSEAVEKIIMGGGKSKVILPLLAQKKATGTNLVIIEVPRALLATNHQDLNETSQRLFGQRAFAFDFNRDSDCSPQHLETIHQHFIEVMTDKAYLVTTGESMQSLQLKYLEILLNRPDIEHSTAEQIREWEKQVYWLGKIVNILKQRSDVVIDEVHQGLLLKKKLNYTLGNRITLNTESIQHSIDLYQFIETINDVSDLADALIEHPDSPLQAAIKTFDASFKEELRAYLQNEYESENIRHASMDLKDTFAFYKEQIRLLPQTLSRKHKANYGPSQIKQENPAIQAIAIPYVANNKPNERSRFGNPLETINYTIQSVLMDGLSAELLAALILRWQTEAREEWKINYPKYADFNQTPTAKRLQALFANTGFTLQTIDVQNQEHIKHVLPTFQHHKPTLFEALKKQILTEIVVEPEILHSDAYNHVDMYRSVQGLSGTPSNHATYHQRLQFNRETSLGTDAYIQNILRGKQTPLHGVDFTTLPTFLKDVFSTLKHPLDARAFIDINATFVGLGNQVVAEALANFVAINNPDIHYILYFNPDNELYALNVTEPGVPIPFSQIINYKPEQCFTYYDQDHTVGVDLKQAIHATGVVFVDEKTQIQSLLQGGMRMRGLENEQTLEIIVPSAMQNHTIDSLMEMMEETERRQLDEDNFFAVLGKMDSLIREHLLGLINALDENDYTKKHQWAHAFKSFLVEKQSSSLYERYGAIYHETDTDAVFREYQASLMDRWMSCMASVQKTADPNDIQSIQASMNTIIETSLPRCPSKSIHNARGAYESAVETQKEQEAMKQQQQLKEQEKQVYIQTNGSRYVPHQHVPWDAKNLTQFANVQSSNIDIKALNEASASTINYSPQLMLSSNFTTIYSGQKDMMGPYMNPVQAILFRMHDNQITACLINNQEAEELYHLLPIKDIWMTSTQHTLLAGERPDWVLNDSAYQTLIEQIRFFSGEWRSLQQQKTPYLWLNEQTQEKLNYFENNLLAFREIAAHEFHQISPLIVEKIKGQATTPIEIMQDDRQAISRIDPHNHKDHVDLHLALNDVNTFESAFNRLSKGDQCSALMVKNKTGQSVLDVIIGLHATKRMIKLPGDWYRYLSPTSSGIQSDVAIGSQNMFSFYLKNWPDTWIDGLAAKKVLEDLAQHHQDLFNIIMKSATDEVRLKHLKMIASSTNFALALDLSLNYPTSFKQLLHDFPQTERLEMLRKKNHQGVSLLDMTAENTVLFSIVQDALPLWERHKARIDEQGNNELHLAVSDKDLFHHILFLIPKGERLDAIMEKNKLDQTIADLALEHPLVYKVMSEALPDFDRHGLMVDKEGNIALHHATGDDEIFRELLFSIPEPWRFQLLMRKNKQGDTVLRLAMNHPAVYEILLDALPDETRYKMFIDKDTGMTLHDSTDPSKMKEKAGKDNPSESEDQDMYIRIIQVIPEKYLLYALTIKDEHGHSVINQIKNNPNLFSLTEVYHLLPPMVLFQIDTDKNGNSILHMAACEGSSAFHAALYALPAEDRMSALMLKNNPECTLHLYNIIYRVWSRLSFSHAHASHYALANDELCYIDVENKLVVQLAVKLGGEVSLKNALADIPVGCQLSEDHLKTITTLTGHTHKKTVLQLALEHGVTLLEILDALPESDRSDAAFSALGIQLKGDKTLLEIASMESLASFQASLHLLKPQDRLAVLLTNIMTGFLFGDATIFTQVMANGLLFSDIIKELPESDHQEAVLNMLSAHILTQAAGDLNTTRIILKCIPQDNLGEYLNEYERHFLFNNVREHENVVDFLKMIQEILPERVLSDLLNNQKSYHGASILEMSRSIESLDALLSLFSMDKRVEMLSDEKTFTDLIEGFQIDGLEVMLKSLAPNHRLSLLEKFIDLEQKYLEEGIQHQLDESDLALYKTELCKFTELLKNELPEVHKLEINITRQGIVIATEFFALKEQLNKLKTLIMSPDKKIEPDTQEINSNESTVYFKEKYAHATKSVAERELTIMVSQIITSYKQLECTIQACEKEPPDDTTAFIKRIDDLTETASTLRADLYQAIEAREAGAVQGDNMDSLKSLIDIAKNLAYQQDERIDQMAEKFERQLGYSR